MCQWASHECKCNALYTWNISVVNLGWPICYCWHIFQVYVWLCFLCFSYCCYLRVVEKQMLLMHRRQLQFVFNFKKSLILYCYISSYSVVSTIFFTHYSLNCSLKKPKPEPSHIFWIRKLSSNGKEKKIKGKKISTVVCLPKEFFIPFIPLLYPWL